MGNLDASEVIRGLRPVDQRTDRPREFWEPTAEYLRSGGGEEVDEFRQRLTEQVRLYPEPCQEELIRRLNHSTETTHRGAIAELAVYLRLRDLPYEVVCDPRVEGGTPDFGLMRDGTLKAVVEVATLSEPLEPGIQKTVDALNELDGGELRVSFEYAGHPHERNTEEQIASQVREWLSDDPTEPLHLTQALHEESDSWAAKSAEAPSW